MAMYECERYTTEKHKFYVEADTLEQAKQVGPSLMSEATVIKETLEMEIRVAHDDDINYDLEIFDAEHILKMQTDCKDCSLTTN